ncbi:PPOX class F420-dependent oxidoreductase [Actinosynnema sp. NPDC047251]|uniref:Pyridoxamine 5'-phosphate oxidase-related FMN-binding protein n=1 Tax=Saccharothrix espanaensis (strain ATCC 51144 / DSM 44229 / JCM 9112 / NBRC 15066 / NRRL 15764) TaxID=1179773 RepID=K0KFW2_SACES|nr:PPOX class F420-dependent oxidoreductase [Saccharothrix espanaensis]CCH35644.1 Pyridoxamine 5'-phosphate oxidase-related FMN-binding protein [Saccharothrix espanaensis DSM 44229]
MGYTDAPSGWWREFVSATPARTGKLAVVRKDGSPHVSPVWVDLDGSTIVFTTHLESVKGRAIVRDGRISLCLDDETPPFAFVTITGRAEIVDDPEQVRYWTGRIGGRYMGAERANEYAERNGGPGEVVVRIRDAKIVAKVDVAE